MKYLLLLLFIITCNYSYSQNWKFTPDKKINTIGITFTSFFLNTTITIENNYNFNKGLKHSIGITSSYMLINSGVNTINGNNTHVSNIVYSTIGLLIGNTIGYLFTKSLCKNNKEHKLKL